MRKHTSLITQLLDTCPHCNVLIARHMIYPDDKRCVYTKDKGWLELNSKLDTKVPLLIRSEDEST